MVREGSHLMTSDGPAGRWPSLQGHQGTLVQNRVQDCTSGRLCNPKRHVCLIQKHVHGGFGRAPGGRPSCAYQRQHLELWRLSAVDPLCPLCPISRRRGMQGWWGFEGSRGNGEEELVAVGASPRWGGKEEKNLGLRRGMWRDGELVSCFS
ncbi:hypothetical protein BGZ61DRAFT_32142 [Ilyonectria robusta]|uniref:uncharacterized protein n=1 Tax=Ilyonectria robusta TaxID=1079257 RepID=UPI001E8DAF1F|nr:uncharacterized protein BGZ61DRAFT_32142 [Ilyonectria robusta]KAH8694526.1 hypothetical protein BGZ61DRAFT_32142 [Ilyonectria robusta]